MARRSAAEQKHSRDLPKLCLAKPGAGNAEPRNVIAK